MQNTNTVCCGVRDRVCRDGMATERSRDHNSDALSRTHVLTHLAFLSFLSLRALLFAIQVTCIRVAVLP